ncbi:MAG: protein kinase [Thermoanaerobaculia bacterium]
MSPLAPGSFVGRYKVISPIGAGAMGEVVLAEDPQIGRRLALKTVRVVEGRPQEIEDRKLRLLREARAAGRLLHPNIVTLFDAGEDQGALFLAFEFVDGMDLASRLGSPPALTLGEALRIVRQAATALDYAHRQGIVHRDIKPSNLLLAKDGEVKVADFGIAKMLDQTSDLTSTGSVVGSPHYLSPEQIRGDELDGRSDIFSLGVVLYEILCRSRPFEGETLTTLVYQILHQEPTSLVVRRPDLGARIEGLVRRMLAKDRDQRFATARDLADEVAAIERESPAPVLARPAAPTGEDLQQTRRLEGTAPTSVSAGRGSAPGAPPPLPAAAAPPPPPPAGGARTPGVTPPTEPIRTAPPPAVAAAPSGSSAKLWIVAVLVVVALAAIVAGGFAARKWLAARGAKVPPAQPSDVQPGPTANVTPPTAPSSPPSNPSAPAPAPSTPASTVPAAPEPRVADSPRTEPASNPSAVEPGTRFHQTTESSPAPSSEPAAPVRPPAPRPHEAPAEAASPPVEESTPVHDEPEPAAPALPEVKIDREMSTGMSLSFEVQPDDLIVKIDRTVIGQANQWNARKGDKRAYELPQSGEHLIRILRDGQMVYAIRITASPDGPSITPIVVNLKPGKTGRTRGRG